MGNTILSAYSYYVYVMLYYVSHNDVFYFIVDFLRNILFSVTFEFIIILFIPFLWSPGMVPDVEKIDMDFH